jgi:hypothetical protein
VVRRRYSTQGGHFWPNVVPNRIHGDADDKGGQVDGTPLW